jgi:hypothetical protein
MQRFRSLLGTTMTVLSMLRHGALCLLFLGFPVATSYAAVKALPAHVLESIAAREYHASVHAHELQAPNRAQGFRTRFRDDGIELVERDSSAQSLLRLSLIQWGPR